MTILQWIVSIFLVILSHYFYKILSRKWRNEPPGPWGLPIFGYSFHLKPKAFRALMKVKMQYPHIAQVDFGQQPIIFLNSYESIKEALLTKGDNFAGRMPDLLVDAIGAGRGIVSSDGAVWKEHRRFALRTLRDFGLGRNRSEEIIQTEIHNLLELLEQEVINGQSHINIMNYLLRSVSNVICTLTMGEQPCYENEEASTLIDKLRHILEQNFFTFPPNMFPTLFKIFSPILSRIRSIQHLLSVFKESFHFLQRKIDEHEKEFNASQESRDYIEAFLREKDKLERIPSENKFYTTNELQKVMFDLFIAGTDTTSNSLSWGLLLLATHPTIQRRCHEEIDFTIGRERSPTMKDKEHLPYIQAVLDEIQRFASIVPLGVIHSNDEDDTIQGYHIPKDSLIIPFLYGVHHDPRIWEKPEQFYPQHFLINVNGTEKYKSREELIPFSIGKRQCLGESLAKMEYFLFFVSILQKYEVSLAEKFENKLQEIMLGTDGPVNCPNPHEIVFQIRS